MKLTEIEPICESYVELLSRDDLSKIIERPLLEACRCLYDKKDSYSDDQCESL